MAVTTAVKIVGVEAIAAAAPQEPKAFPAEFVDDLKIVGGNLGARQTQPTHQHRELL
jgi:hypothetical protein